MAEPGRTSIGVRICQRIFSGVFTMLLPELSHLSDADDQWRAMVVLDHSLPNWLRRSLFIVWLIVFIVSVSVGGLAGIWMNHLLGTGSPSSQLLIWLGCVGSAFILAMLLYFTAYAAIVRRACRTLIHNLGYLICPGCGYSMVGHAGAGTTYCPECGIALDLDSAYDDSLR